MEREGLDSTREGKEDDRWCYESAYIEMDEANALENGDRHAHGSHFHFLSGKDKRSETEQS
jgi:hypothetical protein